MIEQAYFYLDKKIEDEEFEDLTIKKLESIGIKLRLSKSKCCECENFLKKYKEVKRTVESKVSISVLGRILSVKTSCKCPSCPYYTNVSNWDRVKAFSSHLEESGKGISVFIQPYSLELELYE